MCTCVCASENCKILADVTSYYKVALFVHICRTMSRRRQQTYNKEEVLAALYSLSSDDESEDNLEDSEDDGGEDNAGIAANSLVEVETSDIDDDDILYQLADPFFVERMELTWEEVEASAQDRHMASTCGPMNRRCWMNQVK